MSAFLYNFYMVSVEWNREINIQSIPRARKIYFILTLKRRMMMYQRS